MRRRAWIAIVIGGACALALLFGAARGRDRPVTLAAVGDVFFCRGVARQMQKHSAVSMLSSASPILKKADIGFCNLECCLSRRGVPRRGIWTFRADPSYARVLAVSGIRVASAANNHSEDFGRQALMDTEHALKAAGVAAPGAGRDAADACRVRIITVRGLRVGFVAFTDVPCADVVTLDDRPTSAHADIDRIPGEIRAARKACDVLVVSFHWGVEYMKHPVQRQRLLAHMAIDNGADLVLGHHPHVLQTVEHYKGRPIIYSMGAFLWDARIFGADHSAIYMFKLAPDSANLVKIIPVNIINCRPVPAGGL